MKRKILLITTKGCEACKIIDNLIKEALVNYNNIEYEVKDNSEVDSKLLSDNYINDFPATFLIENNQVIFAFTGTKPVNTIRRYINTHF